MLAQAIDREGSKNVTAGANPMDLKPGIEKAVAAVVASLEKQLKPVKGQDIKARVEDAMHATKAAVVVARVREMKGEEGFNAGTDTRPSRARGADERAENA